MIVRDTVALLPGLARLLVGPYNDWQRRQPRRLSSHHLLLCLNVGPHSDLLLLRVSAHVSSFSNQISNLTQVKH